MRLPRVPLLALVLFLAFNSSVIAADPWTGSGSPRAESRGDTGSVSGVVFDQTGAVVADAAVRIAGERLPAGRTTTTTADGVYNFPLLLPGLYTVETDKPGLGRAARNLVVEVDKDTQVDLVLGVTVQEQLAVAAISPVVDLRSSEINFNYGENVIRALPLERTYSGLFQLIPGIAENNSIVGPNGGGSRQDNTYLLDGVNITNPLFGYLSTEVNEFDIVEFNAKRGAVTAEFGRSSGFVTNAVTRSGTNVWTGGARMELIPSAWIAESRGGVTNTTDRWVPSFGLGGPIVHDRAFFYASGQLRRQTTSERVNTFGPLPDEKRRTNEGFAKITAQPSNSQFFNVGYRHRPSWCDYCNIGPEDAPTVARNNEGTNRVISGAWNWFPTNRTVLDVKYLHLGEQLEELAVTDLGFQPPFDPNNLAAMGRFVDPADGFAVGGAALRFNRQNYSRDAIRATVTHFFDVGQTLHQVKAGLGWEVAEENLTRKSNGWGDVTYVQNRTRIQATYYPDQPPQIGRSRTWSLFLQDDMTLSDRVVVNVGLLLNRDEFAQEIEDENTFLTFGFGDEIQPRAGVNVNLRPTAGDKIYASYGRYHALDQKSSARALATRRLYTSGALFDLAGRLISDIPQANTVAKNIDPELSPPHSDEFLVGYATPIAGPWSVDVFFIFRDADDFIEDAPTILPFSIFVYSNDPAAERRYRALTIELARRLADNWSLNLSYGYSKLYGNYDQDYAGGVPGAAVFNTSSLLDDGPGAFVDDTFRQGVLTQDRPHVVKLFGTYVPPQIPHLTLGAYVRAQSGTPWEARGLPWASTTTYLRYLEPAGTNRNDFWTNVDLLASYSVPIGGRANARIEGRLLNAFNTQTALAVDQRKFLDGRIQTITGNPPADCRNCFTDAMVQGMTTPNPRYGTPTFYAPPRRFLLTFLVDF